METVVIIVISLVVISFAASPFLSTREKWTATSLNKKLDALKNQKDIYYQAIKDIDFECAEGKLTEKDHQELRDYYKEKAIQTVRQIEEIENNFDSSESVTNQDG